MRPFLFVVFTLLALGLVAALFLIGSPVRAIGVGGAAAGFAIASAILLKDYDDKQPFQPYQRHAASEEEMTLRK
jgi:hypothetical protein